MLRRGPTALLCFVVLLPGAGPAHGQSLTVYGGPTFSSGIGYFNPQVPGNTLLNEAGTVVARYQHSSGDFRLIRWSAAGIEVLQHLGTSFDTSQSEAVGIDNTGAVYGTSTRFHPVTRQWIGERAVRWAPGTLAPVEYSFPGVDSLTTAHTYVRAVDEQGVVIVSGGTTPLVRYDAAGNPTILSKFNDDSADGTTYTDTTYAVNAAGASAGIEQRLNPDRSFGGNKPLRWRAGDIAPEELLEGDSAFLINNSGVAVGYRTPSVLSQYVVRWAPDSPDAVALETLGVGLAGNKSALPWAINEAGTIVGRSSKYSATGQELGRRAVRWNPFGTAAMELDELPGFATSEAFDINNLEIIVGQATSTSQARAVYWGTDGEVVDLNSLIEPAGGWVLTSARAISDSGWIMGMGTFDPDGPGGQAAYARLFLVQIPEPGGSLLIAAFLVMIPRRREPRR